MKIYGYKRSENLSEELLEMNEVSISGNPEIFRAIAEFLSRAADEIEKHGTEYEHEHLRDVWPEWRESYPDIQAFNSLLEK